ncbi:MAG: twin-arginine translocase subunit TatC [Acidimicrobiales bacterium]
MSLVEHLAELRRRLVVAIVAILVAATVAFGFYNPLLEFFKQPYCHLAPRHCQLYITGPLDGLMLRINVALYGGLVIASPVVLFQLWRFITPGLNPNEKRYAVPFVIFSVVLFLAGAAVAMVSFPHALAFLGAVGGPSLRAIYSPSKYLRLILLMMLAFGLTFEFPVLLVSLELAGVLASSKLASWRRSAVVIIFIAAAVITPSSDPFSMLAMAIPMVAFYEASIWIGRALHK